MLLRIWMFLEKVFQIPSLRRNQAIQYNKKYSQLEKKHLENAKLLTHRDELLALLPKKAVCAEVGVAEGKFSSKIIDITNPQQLHLIDFWRNSGDYTESMYDSIISKFSKDINSGKVVINRGLSIDVLESFNDAYFDWVYIDTDHSYETTLAELEICRRKVKHDGIIAGHDFVLGVWETVKKYGVIEAVYEFCHEYGWQFAYLTMEAKGNHSFALKRIDDN